MSSGLLSGLFWALDTILIGLALTVSGHPAWLPVAPLLSTFLHDLLSDLGLWIYAAVTRRVPDLIRKVPTKRGLIVVLASVLGGPLGMTAYVLSIAKLGPALGAVFSSFFPALGAWMAHVFLKQKLKLHQWLALFLCLASVLVLSMPTTEGIHVDGWGVFWALICVVSWSSETVLCSYAMGEGGLTEEEAIVLRQTCSSVVYLLGIFPVMGVLPLLGGFLHAPNILYLLPAAAFGGVSFLLYYRAIRQVGAGRGMALNITYCAWSLLFTSLFFESTPSLLQLAAAIVLVLSSLVTAGAAEEWFAKRRSGAGLQ